MERNRQRRSPLQLKSGWDNTAEREVCLLLMYTKICVLGFGVVFCQQKSGTASLILNLCLPFCCFCSLFSVPFQDGSISSTKPEVICVPQGGIRRNSDPLQCLVSVCSSLEGKCLLCTAGAGARLQAHRIVCDKVFFPICLNLTPSLHNLGNWIHHFQFFIVTE